jgi:peptide/nickel transport system permease protein
MRNYVIRRVLSTIPVALVVGTVVFFLAHLIPGDPARIMAGPDASQADLERITRNLGLDRPLYIQYVTWLGNVVRGDLGESFFQQQPVLTAVISRMEPTVTLAILATLFSLSLGVPLGIIAAQNRGSVIDRIVMAFAVAGISIPYFWLGLMLVALFAVQLGWLPAVGYASPYSGDLSALRHLVMPVVALGFSASAFTARLTRTSMVQILEEDYVRTARAKGVSGARVLFKHALPNSLIMIVTSIGLTFASLLSGAIITEVIFNIPGIGRLILESIHRRDYPLIQGVILIIAIFNVVVNLVVDLLYGVIDPRISYD